MQGWRDRISMNPKVCHGKACIHGTRIPVSVVTDNRAVGISRNDVLTSYPRLVSADLDAALLYTAELSRKSVL